MCTEIIAVEHLQKSFSSLEVIKDISFNVHKGEVLGIIGPSGSGKSTLLRCITQLERVSSGLIRICGQTLVSNQMEKGQLKPIYASKEEMRDIALKVGLVFQNFNLFPHFTVLQNVNEAQIQVLKKSPEEATENSLALLKK